MPNRCLSSSNKHFHATIALREYKVIHILSIPEDSPVVSGAQKDYT